MEVGQRARHLIRNVIGSIIHKAQSNAAPGHYFYILKVGAAEYTVFEPFLELVPTDGNDILRGML